MRLMYRFTVLCRNTSERVHKKREGNPVEKASGNRSESDLIFTVYVFIFLSKKKAMGPQRKGTLKRD